MNYDLDEVEAAVVAVYAAQLPIPTWWPEQERAAFIAEHAGYAFGALVTELNDVVDRVIDRAARSTSPDGGSLGAEDIADLIAINQEALLEIFSQLPDHHPRRRGGCPLNAALRPQ